MKTLAKTYVIIAQDEPRVDLAVLGDSCYESKKEAWADFDRAVRKDFTQSDIDSGIAKRSDYTVWSIKTWMMQMP